MNIQKIVLGICLCFVTPGYAQLGVIAQSKRIQVVPQPVAQVDRPGTFMLTSATPWQVENDEQAEVVKRFGQQLQEEGSGWKIEVSCNERSGTRPASTTTMALPAAASATLVSGKLPAPTPAHSLQVISLNHCDSLADEGYRLRITPDSLQIQASAPHHPRFSSNTGLRKGRLLLCAADRPSAAAPRPSEGYEQPDAGMGASLCGDYRSAPFRVQGTHAGCFALFYSQSNPPANHRLHGSAQTK